jgi:hypothetical protein
MNSIINARGRCDQRITTSQNLGRSPKLRLTPFRPVVGWTSLTFVVSDEESVGSDTEADVVRGAGEAGEFRGW